MRGSNRPKQAHSRPQRRHRFHHPHQPNPQRRHRFHHQPKNTTGGPTTRPHTARHETHSTNARVQPPKTSPFTPAKATPVSPPPPTKPAKATPVSQASQPHCHLELRPGQNRLSFTGSGRNPREGRTLTTEPRCFTRVSRAPTRYRHRYLDEPCRDSLLENAFHRLLTRQAMHPCHALALHELHGGAVTLASTSRHGHRKHHCVHGRSVRVGGVRREEWGHGR